MLGIGPSELLIIFLIVFLLFGAKKLPELARGLGKAVKEFKKAAREIEEATEPEQEESKKSGEERQG